MSLGFQPTLFDADTEHPQLGALRGPMRRTELAHGAWIDYRPGWVQGTTAVFDRLRDEVPWRTQDRQMYDRTVAVPRLLATYMPSDRLPHALLADARDDLSAHYLPVLPTGFATAGLCFYRDGSDSVAWHGDRIGRGRSADTLIAIVSLGATRPLMLRPRGGGESRRVMLSSGDLLVMGGSCQRTWDHAIPKVRGAGPRISIQFRPTGVW